MDTNISQARCSQHCIADSMQQYIRIAVAKSSLRVRDMNPAYPKISVCNHLVKVNTKANSVRHTDGI